MGWSTDTKEQGVSIAAHFERKYANSSYGTIIKSASVRSMYGEGYVWFAAVRPHEAPETVTAWINLVKVHPDAGYGNITVKEMSETMGPCEYNCPAAILDLLTNPAPNDYAREWREKCREYAARQAAIKARAPLTPGMRLRFDKPLVFGGGIGEESEFIVEVAGRSPVFRTVRTWRRVKISKWRERDYTVVAPATATSEA